MLGEVFDIEQGLDFIKGKLFDIKITVLSTVLFVAYAVLSAYLKIATNKALAALSTVRTPVIVSHQARVLVRKHARA